MTVNTLLYKHFCYQEDILEGVKHPQSLQSAYNKWSNYCVITAITPTYIKIELPDKTKSSVISHYSNHKIKQGYWVVCADYDRDIDQYYWCRYKAQSHMRKWMLRIRCSGPCLIHTIDLR